jgi:AAA family ATP:ADP antiporter
VREPLILGESGGGAEVKSYVSAAQAVALVGVALAFGWLASRVRRLALLTVVGSFFVLNLVAFVVAFVLLPAWHLHLGIAFFIWVGCFSVMIISQLWAFANDLYTKEQGERLFGIIAAGSAVGAVVGAKVAKPLFKAFGAYGTMLTAAAILVLSIVLTRLVHETSSGEADTRSSPGKLADDNGFALLLGDRYLLFVGLLSLLKNWVNTTGEYILDRRLVEAASSQASEHAREVFIAGFKSDYFTYVNVIVMVLQFFAVSRIVKHIGIRKALFILPAIAFASYSTMAAIPLLSVILVGKIAENSTDYSLQKTTEQMLFLVTSREAKYKAKAIVDTFLVRLGDVMSAATVWIGAQLELSTVTFIFINMGLVVAWAGCVLAIGRAHTRREADAPAETTALVPARPLAKPLIVGA